MSLGYDETGKGGAGGIARKSHGHGSNLVCYWSTLLNGLKKTLNSVPDKNVGGTERCTQYTSKPTLRVSAVASLELLNRDMLSLRHMKGQPSVTRPGISVGSRTQQTPP